MPNLVLTTRCIALKNIVWTEFWVFWVTNLPNPVQGSHLEVRRVYILFYVCWSFVFSTIECNRNVPVTDSYTAFPDHAFFTHFQIDPVILSSQITENFIWSQLKMVNRFVPYVLQGLQSAIVIDCFISPYNYHLPFVRKEALWIFRPELHDNRMIITTVNNTEPICLRRLLFLGVIKWHIICCSMRNFNDPRNGTTMVDGAPEIIPGRSRPFVASTPIITAFSWVIALQPLSRLIKRDMQHTGSIPSTYSPSITDFKICWTTSDSLVASKSLV